MSVLLPFEILTLLGTGLRLLDPAIDYHSCTELREHAGISDSSVCVVFCTDVPLCIAGFLFSTLWREREIKQRSTKLFSVFSPMGKMKNKFNKKLWAIGAKKVSSCFFPTDYIFSLYLILLYHFAKLICIVLSTLFSNSLPVFCVFLNQLH